MKTLKDRLIESITSYIRPLLCIRINSEEKVLYYMDDHDAVQYIFMPMSNLEADNAIAKKIKNELIKNNYEGYKTAEKLDMINELVELTEEEIEALAEPQLKKWFKENNGAQPWILDGYQADSENQ